MSPRTSTRSPISERQTEKEISKRERERERVEIFIFVEESYFFEREGVELFIFKLFNISHIQDEAHASCLCGSRS